MQLPYYYVSAVNTQGRVTILEDRITLSEAEATALGHDLFCQDEPPVWVSIHEVRRTSLGIVHIQLFGWGLPWDG